MPGKGRAPTPTATLEARGSWRAKTRRGEPRPATRLPACPRSLKGEARAEWRRQGKHMVAMGIIAESDRALLAVWCQAWAEFIALIDATEGPELRRRDAAADRLMKASDRLGFSPAARTRVRAEREAREGGDGKARFFGQAAG